MKSNEDLTTITSTTAMGWCSDGSDGIRFTLSHPVWGSATVEIQPDPDLGGEEMLKSAEESALADLDWYDWERDALAHACKVLKGEFPNVDRVATGGGCEAVAVECQHGVVLITGDEMSGDPVWWIGQHDLDWEPLGDGSDVAYEEGDEALSKAVREAVAGLL